jgi:predicted amidohydrolase YtcJ
MAARVTAFVVSAIVAITFVAGLIVGAQREDDSGPIDLIVYNARVYVGDPAKGFAEAIAIRGNRILKVGSNHDIKRLMRRATSLIDARGGSVLPGFNDAGLDLFADGFELETVRRTIADAHRVGLTSAHVVLRSADDLALLEDLEKRGELTLRVSAALTASLPIDAAEVDRLEAIRRLHPGDALLKVAAVKLIVPVSGIQPIVDRNTPTSAMPAGAVPVPASAVNPNPNPNDAKTASRRVGAQTAQAAQAATSAGRHARAKKAPAPIVINADTLATAIAMLDQHNWQVIVAPADADGVEMTLEAFQQALKTPRLDNSPRRHRIELPGPLDASTSARFDALGIVQAFQSAAPPAVALAALPVAAAAPAAAAALPASAEAPATSPSSAATTAAATAATMPTTRLAPISSRAIFRSDWPARPLDPRITLAAAIAEDATDATAPTDDASTARATRTSRAAWLAGAIDAYTSRAAYATFDEARKGTIAKDMLADLVIFSTDLFAAKSATTLTDTTITTTVANGRLVFTADQSKPALSTAP